MNGRVPISKTDDLDILSGIWIMSCNDDNPIMTYRSIRQRLDLSETHDVKAIVRSRPELFRPGILDSRLSAWKDLMKSGKSRPAWIVEIQNAVEQRQAIDALTRDDVFRSQFRVEDGAPKSDIEIIDWGLQHIDRLRKAAADEKEVRSRKWNLIIIPTVSLIIALASVIVSGLTQWHSANQQEETKRYEIEFAPKQRGFSSFMNDMMLAATSANAGDEDKTLDHLNRMELDYYAFEPFLDEKTSADVVDKYMEFARLCLRFPAQIMLPKNIKTSLGSSARSKLTFVFSFSQFCLHESD
jgi:hypothetical protein